MDRLQLLGIAGLFAGVAVVWADSNHDHHGDRLSSADPDDQSGPDIDAKTEIADPKEDSDPGAAFTFDAASDTVTIKLGEDETPNLAQFIYVNTEDSETDFPARWFSANP